MSRLFSYIEYLCVKFIITFVLKCENYTGEFTIDFIKYLTYNITLVKHNPDNDSLEDYHDEINDDQFSYMLAIIKYLSEHECTNDELEESHLVSSDILTKIFSLSTDHNGKFTNKEHTFILNVTNNKIHLILPIITSYGHTDMVVIFRADSVGYSIHTGVNIELDDNVRVITDIKPSLKIIAVFTEIINTLYEIEYSSRSPTLN